MKITVYEIVKPGQHRELIKYESEFIPSVGDIMAASSFPDLEQRPVVMRLIIPTISEAVLIYCAPPDHPIKWS